MNLSPEAFWSLTPYELNIKLEYQSKREKEKSDIILSTAWHTAYFQRVKKLKKLEDYAKERKPGKPKKRIESKEELEQIAKNKGIKLPKE